MVFEIDVLEMQLKILDFSVADNWISIQFFHYHSIFCPRSKLMVKSGASTENAKTQQIIYSRHFHDYCQIEFESALF